MTVDIHKIAKSLIGDIAKKHGENSVIDLGKDKVESNVERVSSGLPSLDLVLGGGIPKGRLIEVFGPESSGKTTMAIHMLIQFQKDNPEKYVAYLDIENAFDIEYATALGLNMSKVFFSQPSSGEEALDIVEKMCQSEIVTSVVIDSVAQLVPRAAGDKDIDGTANIGTTARLLSQTLPRLSNEARKSGTTLIFINQIRMKIGVMYGNPETTPGGLAMRFATSVRLEVRGTKPENKNGKEGHVVKVKAIKNKVGKPKTKTELFLIYGEGFDPRGDLLETAQQLEIVIRKGAYYEYGDLRCQGWQNFVTEISKDEIKMKEIYDIIIDSK